MFTLPLNSSEIGKYPTNTKQPLTSKVLTSPVFLFFIVKLSRISSPLASSTTESQINLILGFAKAFSCSDLAALNESLL